MTEKMPDYWHNKSFWGDCLPHRSCACAHGVQPAVCRAVARSCYGSTSVPPSDFTAMIRALQSQSNFGGLTATIPHKMAMADLCDTLGPAACISGAVNAVRFNADGTIDGDNFDGEGFVAGMISRGHEITGRTALLLGAGGAARHCHRPVFPWYQGSENSNRTHENAAALVSALENKGGFEQAW